MKLSSGLCCYCNPYLAKLLLKVTAQIKNGGVDVNLMDNGSTGSSVSHIA